MASETSLVKPASGDKIPIKRKATVDEVFDSVAVLANAVEALSKSQALLLGGFEKLYELCVEISAVLVSKFGTGD